MHVDILALTLVTAEINKVTDTPIFSLLQLDGLGIFVFDLYHTLNKISARRTSQIAMNGFTMFPNALGPTLGTAEKGGQTPGTGKWSFGTIDHIESQIGLDADPTVRIGTHINNIDKLRHLLRNH